MAKTGLLQSGEIGELLTREVDTALPGFLKGGDFAFDSPASPQEGIAQAEPLEGGALGAEALDLPQLDANVNRQLDFIQRILGSKSLDRFPGRQASRQPLAGLTPLDQSLRVALPGRAPTEVAQQEIVTTGLGIQKEQAAFGQRADTEDRLLRREKYKDNNDLRKAQAYFDRYLQAQGLGFKMAQFKRKILVEERNWKYGEKYIKQVIQAAEINEKKKELQTEAASLMVQRATDTTRPQSERLRVLSDGTTLPGSPATLGALADMIKQGKITGDHLRTVKVKGTQALEIIDGFFQEQVPKDIEENGIMAFWTASDFYAQKTGRKFPTKIQEEEGQTRLRDFRKAWSASKNPQATFRNLVQRFLDKPETETTAIEDEFGLIFTEGALQAAKELAPVYWERAAIVGRLDIIDDLNDNPDPKVKQVLQETTTLEEGLTEEDLYERIKNEVMGPGGEPNWEKLAEIARDEMQRVNIGGTSNEIMGLDPEKIGSLWEELGLTGLHDQKQSYFEQVPLSMAMAEGEAFPRSLAEGARLGVLGEVGREELQRRQALGAKARVKAIKKPIVSKIMSGTPLDETDREIIRQYRSQKEFEKAQGDLTIDEMFDNEILKMSLEEESPKRPGPPLSSP